MIDILLLHLNFRPSDEIIPTYLLKTMISQIEKPTLGLDQWQTG